MRVSNGIIVSNGIKVINGIVVRNGIVIAASDVASIVYCSLLNLVPTLNFGAIINIDGPEITVDHDGSVSGGLQKVIRFTPTTPFPPFAPSSVTIHGVTTNFTGNEFPLQAVTTPAAFVYNSLPLNPDVIANIYADMLDIVIVYQLDAGDITPDITSTGDYVIGAINIDQSYEAPEAEGFIATVQSVQTFEIADNLLWTGLTIESSVNGGFVGGGVFLTNADGIFVLLGTGAADGEIWQYNSLFDFPPVVLESGLSLSLPLNMNLLADGATGNLYYDIGNGLQLIANIPTLGTGSKSVGVLAGGQSGFTNDSVVMTLNAGYVTPVIAPPVGYVSYCNLPVTPPPPPPPPSELPSFAQIGFFDPANNPNVAVVQTEGTFDVTTLDGFSQNFILQTEWFYCPSVGEVQVAEITVNSVSHLDLTTPANIQLVFGHGPFGGLEGIGVLLGSVDGVTADGALFDSFLQTGLIGSQAFPQGYTVQVRLNEFGQMSYVDTLGNSGNLGVTLFLDQAVLLMVLVQTPEAVGGNINFTLNTGGSPLVITPPAGFVSLAASDECYNAYRLFEFFPINGDVVLGAPLQGNLPRGLNINKDGITIPEFTGSVGSAGLSAIVNYNKNLYEFHCNSRAADMDNKIIRLATNQVFSGQLEIAHSDGFSGADGVDGTPHAWAIRTFTGFNNELSLVPLFNHVPLVAGDSIAMAVEKSENSINITNQFVLTLGGQQIVYDPIGNVLGDPNLTFTPILQLKSSSNAPPNDSSNYQFNGVSADYAQTYPADRGFTDIVHGVAITNTVVSTRQALLAPFTWKSESDVVATVDITKKILTIDGSLAVSPVTAFAHCPLVISRSYVLFNFPVYLLEMEITSVNASQSNGYFLELVSPNSREVIAIRYYLGELHLEMTWDAAPPNLNMVTTREQITFTGGTYVPQSGDRVAILIGTSVGDNSPGSGAPGARGMFQRGVNPIEVSAHSTNIYEFDGEYEYADFIPRMGHNSIPVGESTVITSKFKAADMSPDFVSYVNNIHPSLAPQDIEGVNL